MTYPSFSYVTSHHLFHHLTAQHIVITVNQRLARFDLQAFEAQQRSMGKQAWETPQILPWHAWLRQQWLHADIGVWLHNTQETLLWQQVIEQDSHIQVLNTKALAKQAMEAWQIMADYLIDPACLQHAGEEHQALWRWGMAMEQATTHYLSCHILDKLSRHPVPPSRKLCLHGFDSLTPAQLQYLKHLQTHGWELFMVESGGHKADTRQYACADEDDELRFVCAQVRACMQHHEASNIAIIIPNLERKVQQVNRILAEELAPALSLESNEDQQGNFFNLSLGSSLATHPLVQTCLTILGLSAQYMLKFSQVEQLLLNPYLPGFEDERAQRANLAAWLRQHNQHTITLAQWLEYCQAPEHPLPHLAHLLKAITNFAHSQRNMPKQHLSQWVTLAEGFLAEYFWHKQCLSSLYETAQRDNWSDMLRSLPALDDICKPISWFEALSYIQDTAFECAFRPSPSSARVQVMGLLEARGLRFDQAFVLGMDDSTWPPAAKPHPLIPVDIQVQYQTPHANSEREWQFAQSVWQDLLYIAPHVVFTYARLKGGQETSASPFLTHIPKAEPQLAISHRLALSLQQASVNLSPIPDEPLAVLPQESISGGTSIMKAQAACPFQAFARYRLKLNGLENTRSGLTPAEQGILLHAALEYFWQHARHSGTLDAWIAENTLASHIDSSIAYAWHKLKRKHPVPASSQKLEHIRLQHLLHEWLAFENQRPPFAVVGTEFQETITLGRHQLILRVKIDRMDKTTAGHTIILDYKTGQVSAGATQGTRPDEPQLPMYYWAKTYANQSIDAVAFAQVREGDVRFIGFAHDEGILPAIKAHKGKKDEHGQHQTWDMLIQQWQDTLHQLADAFMEGKASVSPKSTKSCTYCAFSGLCRIQW